jgi:hypothetical protein
VAHARRDLTDPVAFAFVRDVVDPPPPLTPPDTLVVITTCDRHRGYPGWYHRVLAAVVLLLGGGWAFSFARLGWDAATRAGTLAVAGCVTVTLILILGIVIQHPVRVTIIRRDTVLLSGVSRTYFGAPEPPT